MKSGTQEEGSLTAALAVVPPEDVVPLLSHTRQKRQRLDSGTAGWDTTHPTPVPASPEGMRATTACQKLQPVEGTHGALRKLIYKRAATAVRGPPVEARARGCGLGWWGTDARVRKTAAGGERGWWLDRAWSGVGVARVAWRLQRLPSSRRRQVAWLWWCAIRRGGRCGEKRGAWGDPWRCWPGGEVVGKSWDGSCSEPLPPWARARTLTLCRAVTKGSETLARARSTAVGSPQRAANIGVGHGPGQYGNSIPAGSGHPGLGQNSPAWPMEKWSSSSSGRTDLWKGEHRSPDHDYSVDVYSSVIKNKAWTL